MLIHYSFFHAALKNWANIGSGDYLALCVLNGHQICLNQFPAVFTQNEVYP